MAQNSPPDRPGSPLPDPHIRKRPRVSAIWLIPIITLLVAGWLGYRTVAEKGPLVTITFATADGLEIGKSTVKYRGVYMGVVEDLSVTKDLSKVAVKARLTKPTEPHLKEGSKFWVVRPQLSLEGASGLSTLVSGDYIAFEPGDGAPALHFEGLAQGPEDAAGIEGRNFILRTDDLGSVKAGTPLLFHGIKVGKVEEVALSDKRQVLIHIAVHAPHEDLVRENSRFWDVSGLEFDAGDLLDVSVKVASFESLIAGGIAFDNPPPEGAAAKAGATFQLYGEKPEEFTSKAHIEGLELRFRLPKLHGVGMGSALTFQGLKVGEVTDINLSDTKTGIEIRAIVEEPYKHLVKSKSSFWLSGGLDLSLRSFLSSSKETESFRDLLGGAIQFANPPDAGDSVAQGTLFELLTESPAFVETAKGLEVKLVADAARGVAAEDPVLYRGLTVGEVRSVEISDDGSEIHVDAVIREEFARLVRANSIFWNASGLHFKAGDFLDASLDIDSLATLMVGGIAFETPGDPGPLAENGASYNLLSEHPHDEDEKQPGDERLHIALQAANLGSVKADDPVLYRELQVGKVVEVGLNEDASRVRISLVIEEPYKPLIKTTTVFWNASGFHAKFGLSSGFQIDVESLSALLRGGIAFATPPDNGEAIKGPTVFPLHDRPKKEWRAWAPHIRLPKQDERQSAGGTPVEATKQAAVPAAKAEAVPAPAAVETVIHQAIPDWVELGADSHINPSLLASQLSDLGFENVDQIEVAGSVIKLEASWEGQPLALVINAANGRIKATKN